MKLLIRNMTEFEYLAPDGEATDVNEDGEHTGEFRPSYAEAVTYRGNISAPNGQTQYQFYGEDLRYTHTLLMSDKDAGIQEGGLIRWKGHTYDIVAVRTSLNVLSAALMRQTDTEDED